MIRLYLNAWCEMMWSANPHYDSILAMRQRDADKNMAPKDAVFKKSNGAWVRITDIGGNLGRMLRSMVT